MRGIHSKVKLFLSKIDPKLARSLKICALVLALAYVASYIALSKAGRYEPAAYGLGADLNGDLMLVPKSAFGYVWLPSVIFPDDGSPYHWFWVVFQPLHGIDSELWHTPERMESGNYRIVNYFDYETRSYSNHEPK
jgi:hypothetical protein